METLGVIACNGDVTESSTPIRWSKELSDGEKAATKERQKIIADCLGRHSIKCNQDNVPRVAVLGSGGGVRAMIALMGTLGELGKEDLLDSIMYLSGVSGSTWCMSSVYEDVNWSKNVTECENRLNERLNVPAHLQPGTWEKIKHAIEDGVCSLTVLWSYLVGNHMIKAINENSLANHKEACEHGVNPYPIYAAVEKENIVKDKKTAPGTWFEFTPHDAGFPDFGAFVKTEDIGSKFEKGNLESVKAQQTICYLQGLWGSALANENEISAYIREHIFSWFKGHEDTPVMAAAPCGPSMRMQAGVAEMSVAAPPECSCECCKAAHDLMALSVEELSSEAGQAFLMKLEMLLQESERNGVPHMHPPQSAVEDAEVQLMAMSARSFLPSIISSACENVKIFAKLMKCLLSWQWGTTHNFLYKCSPEGTTIPSDFAEKEFINLIDAGLAINSAYPLVLRPQRKVDLVLSFDYSAGDPFETLKRSAEYCKANKIPFPDIKVPKRDEKTPSGCYIFKGPNAPTVMHFPLFNSENCAGDIEKYSETFSTFQASYGKDNVDDLLRVSKLNVQKQKSKILEELASAVHAL